MLKFGLKTGGVLLGSLMLFAVWSCSPSGPVKPDGLPPLVPCEVTITQEGKPLAGAHVELRNKASGSGWATDGVTDDSGVAKIKINGTFLGAPEGEYFVLVTKTELSPSKLPDTPPSDPIEKGKWNEAKARESRDVFVLVDEKFAEPKTSPLSMTVSKSEGSATFDVEKAVRIQKNKPSTAAPTDSTYD